MLVVMKVEGFLCLFFFFSSRRRHTRSLCDWSSDVCSSDLAAVQGRALPTSVPHLAPGGGHGIIGMRERATLLGGTLHTEAGRQEFRLSARLPRRKAAP